MSWYGVFWNTSVPSSLFLLVVKAFVKKPYVLQYSATSKMNFHFMFLFLYFRNLFSKCVSACILFIKTSSGVIRFYYVSVEEIPSVPCYGMHIQTDVHAQNSEVQSSTRDYEDTDVQEDCICIFCACTHMRESMFSLYINTLQIYLPYIYIALEQFAKFYSTASWFLNDKYLLGGWKLLCQVSVQIAHFNIRVKEPWKMKYILETKWKIVSFCSFARWVLKQLMLSSLQ